MQCEWPAEWAEVPTGQKEWVWSEIMVILMPGKSDTSSNVEHVMYYSTASFTGWNENVWKLFNKNVHRFRAAVSGAVSVWRAHMCPVEIFLLQVCWDLGNTLPSFLSGSSVLSRDVILDSLVSTLRTELAEIVHIKYFYKVCLLEKPKCVCVGLV